MSFLPTLAATASFNPAVIDRVRSDTTKEAMDAFQHIDAILGAASLPMEYRQSYPAKASQIARERLKVCLSSISGDATTLYRVVDDVLWDVLKLSAHVAAHHDAAVQARVDAVTATVLVSLYPFKPMMTREGRDSLLYRCVRETTHVFGPETIAVISSRYDQCFREKELLDADAIALFELRYHHKVLDGYTARTCRPPPYAAAV